MLFKMLHQKLTLVSILGAIGILLPACANNQFATYTAAGAVFPKAEFVVKGKTRYDQTWIDKTIEAEVAGFSFPRPKPRPAYLDAPAAKPQVVVKPPEKATTPILLPTPKTTAPLVTVAPPPKPSLTQRLRIRIRQLEDKLKHKGGG